jgi:hypothetical protein
MWKIHIPHPAFEDRPDKGFRNVGKPQKEHIQYSKHGESLKSGLHILNSARSVQ